MKKKTSHYHNMSLIVKILICPKGLNVQ